MSSIAYLKMVMDMSDIKITIMTPTYNRSSFLPKLYVTLTKQTVDLTMMEWIIVDDGSTDDTEDTVHELKGKSPFEIKYIKSINGGKHHAVNIGLEHAAGEFFFIVDSDDTLPENSIERIIFWFNTLKSEQEKYAGIGGLKSYGGNVGESFEGEYLDCSSIERREKNIKGDKAEVFYTDVIKKYRFPEFRGEKFLSECVLWNEIARDGYKIRWFNETIYRCEYLASGLTRNIYHHLAQSPKGFLLYTIELMRYEADSELRRMYYAGAYHVLVGNTKRSVLSKELKISVLKIIVGSYIFRIAQKRKARRLHE